MDALSFLQNLASWNIYSIYVQWPFYISFIITGLLRNLTDTKSGNWFYLFWIGHKTRLGALYKVGSATLNCTGELKWSNVLPFKKRRERIIKDCGKPLPNILFMVAASPSTDHFGAEKHDLEGFSALQSLVLVTGRGYRRKWKLLSFHICFQKLLPEAYRLHWTLWLYWISPPSDCKCKHDRTRTTVFL